MSPIVPDQAHLPALASHERAELANELQATLVELVDLSLLGKQLHWSVVGPQFRPLHLYLDELVDSWRELADAVAERAVALGAWPDGQARTVAADSPIAPVERGAVEDRELVRELAGRIAEVAERTCPPDKGELAGGGAVASGSRRECAGHALHPVDEGAAQELRLVRLDVGHHAQQFPEDRAQLRSRQRGAEAVVRPAAAEAQVAVWVSGQVDAPRILERTLVPIGRVVEEHHL